MKLFARVALAAATAGLATAPALAAPANPAASLSVTKSRAASPAAKSDQLAGSGLVVAIVAGVAVIVAIILIADDDDNGDSN